MINFPESKQWYFIPENSEQFRFAYQKRLDLWGLDYQSKADEIAPGVSDRWDYVNITWADFIAYQVAAHLEPAIGDPYTYQPNGPPSPVGGGWNFIARHPDGMATATPLEVASAMATGIVMAQIQSIMIYEQVEKMARFHLRGEQPNV